MTDEPEEQPTAPAQPVDPHVRQRIKYLIRYLDGTTAQIGQTAGAEVAVERRLKEGLQYLRGSAEGLYYIAYKSLRINGSPDDKFEEWLATVDTVDTSVEEYDPFPEGRPSGS